MKRVNQCRGYTLLELLLVVSVATVLLGVNVGWIFQTMKFASTTKQRQQSHQNLTRLAWALRDDVHQCNSISMVGENQLTLATDRGLLVTYTIAGTELLVEKREASPVVKRERYELARDATAIWDTSELPDWISLIVFRGRESADFPSTEKAEPPPLLERSNPVDLRVRVAPNRWAVRNVDGSREKSGNEEPK